MRKLTYLLILVSLLSSCEEVIEIDLNSASPTMVVEAKIEDGKTCSVKLTKTGDFFGDAATAQVTNATISLSDGEGNSEVLTHDGEGYYSGAMLGEIGKKYSMSINEDKHYLATSTMMDSVEIDQIVYIPSQDGPGQNNGPGAGPEEPKYQVVISFQDNENETNYYRIVHYLNGEFLSGTRNYLVLNDNVINGNQVDIGLFRTTFKRGDIVTVELIQIDKELYDYYNTLVDALSTNQRNSSTPFNPTSNFNEDAMGYFGALSTTRKTIMIR